MISTGYPVAFLGGLLALLSPCGAVLLPAFFAYSFSGSAARLLGRTAVFYAGLCCTLVPLGVAGSTVGRFFHGNRELVVAVGGWTVIALGTAQILGFGLALPARVSGRHLHRAGQWARSGSLFATLTLGAVYGLAGFCAGPILGAVLTVSAVGGDRWYGAALLAVYALGMACPLFLLAAVWDRFRPAARRGLRGRTLELAGGRLRLHSLQVVGGLVFVLVGVVFLLSDGTAGLPGPLSAEQGFRLEEWAVSVGSAVPGTALLYVLAGGSALTGMALAYRAWRQPPPPPTAQRAGTQRAGAQRAAADGEAAAGTTGSPPPPGG
ncbi:cytochrome c biogenesis CcdA family protein [Streptomyces aidingensis]|uniref:Cytochrome c biogenesis protein CcdA n=1 Tax=Streptomyces aidingensis TaxID=910347 RepID=A0A1I1EC28_9ACTN|nr:cytochrome c biogenesis CcdA family protein [Streptomyces aidingensis]SFB84296.1 Cytochrome c biogenesis protein CcdA [Streptomyces aidingensis]